MDELLKQITVRSAENLASFTYAEFGLSIVLAFLLAMVISLVYRATHTGLSYSRSFSTTMVLMAVTVSFIMLIIGSNLARAFSLVGALSIIRYRNAVRESRDTAFIFVTMAIGMACGVRLYGQAVLFTALASAILVLLEKTQFGTIRKDERLLRFSLEAGSAALGKVDALVAELSTGAALLSSETLGDRRVLTYSVEIPREKANAGVIDDLSKQLDGADVKMLTGFEKFSV
jgi:uncharacterized membrane protein YhiD involved in acid resistance